MKKNTVVRSGVILIICLLPIAFMLARLKWKLFSSPMSEENLATTEANCAQLVLPRSFTKISEGQSIKTDAAVFSNTYRSGMSREAVASYFRENLGSQDWRYTEEAPRGELYLVFQRNGYSIVIESQGLLFSSDVNYSVSCSFGLR
ncbi:MAG: hypothetical protein ABI791_15125 [Acidobacteriota bacterium]